MEHDVFISYSSKDRSAAQAICHVLEQNNIRCWIAPRDIPPGADYGDVIDKAIIASKTVVVLFSETASASQWVKGEMNVAFEEQKTIIPFRLDQTPLKGQTRVMLNQRHWIDAYPDYESKFTDLVSAVSMSLGRTSVPHDIQGTVPAGSQKTVGSKKSFWTVVVAVSLVLIAISYYLFTPHASVFSYDKNGLHVNSIEKLTESQINALTTILDNMVLVEGGTFSMGNDYSQEEWLTEQDSLSCNPHKVNVSKFYISKYELTQKQWSAFCDMVVENAGPGDDKAVDNLSWEAAQAFADTLATITGLSVALPTEAQWEYAAKGGAKGRGKLFSGFTDDNPGLFAWIHSDALTSAEEVGKKLPNELDLYDMTGNVSEWCSDYFAPYATGTVDNPTGPKDGMYRIYRGGDYTTPNLQDMKTSTRYYAAPFLARKGTGLRLVINLK